MTKNNTINNDEQLAEFTRAITLEAELSGWDLPVVIAKFRKKYDWSHADYNQVVEYFQSL